ncbi:hypothetical protein BDV96DRAFT_607955 [Lophiotrema nucula]|uniref:Uncharacterized protein n=1 Tax=Lophiotrema nucula TaxID=690887 RepID=A0A6A5YHD7_9PLEO|nr:hypothetical protein BDV96DRAFT_607955 [Lophiotrema nucula]
MTIYDFSATAIAYIIEGEEPCFMSTIVPFLLYVSSQHAAAETLTTSCHAFNGYGAGKDDNGATVSVLSANPTATTAVSDAVTALTTTTYASPEEASISLVPLYVTAGQEKLAAATGAASSPVMTTATASIATEADSSLTTPSPSATNSNPTTTPPPSATGSILTTTCHNLFNLFSNPKDRETVSVLSANPTATTYISTYVGLCDNTLTRATTCIMTVTHVDGPSTIAETVSVDKNLAYTYQRAAYLSETTQI